MLQPNRNKATAVQELPSSWLITSTFLFVAGRAIGMRQKRNTLERVAEVLRKKVQDAAVRFVFIAGLEGSARLEIRNPVATRVRGSTQVFVFLELIWSNMFCKCAVFFAKENEIYYEVNVNANTIITSKTIRWNKTIIRNFVNFRNVFIEIGSNLSNSGANFIRKRDRMFVQIRRLEGRKRVHIL